MAGSALKYALPFIFVDPLDVRVEIRFFEERFVAFSASIRFSLVVQLHYIAGRCTSCTQVVGS